MVARRSRSKAGPPRDPNVPRGQLEAFARRVGGQGYSLTPHALFRCRKKLDLENFDLLVLLAILSHAGNEYPDFACASYEVLASDTGLDRKTVVRRVARLRDRLGLLTWANKRKPDKSLTPNIYNVQPLAQKLKALAAEASPDGAEDEDFDAIIAELMAEPGPDMDLADSGGMEVPASPSRKGKRGFATIEKDPDDDGRDDERADRSADRPRTTTTRPRSPSRSSSRKATASSPWTPGSSRLRKLEMDEPDRAQLDKGERLRHPDGRELTVDEHLRRMREMECYSRPSMADLLIELGFPSEDVTAAMNAGPVEHLRRLAGGVPPAEAPAKELDGPYLELMPPDAERDPVLREAVEAINRMRLKLWNEKHGKS